MREEKENGPYENFFLSGILKHARDTCKGKVKGQATTPTGGAVQFKGLNISFCS